MTKNLFLLLPSELIGHVMVLFNFFAGVTIPSPIPQLASIHFSNEGFEPAVFFLPVVLISVSLIGMVNIFSFLISILPVADPLP